MFKVATGNWQLGIGLGKAWGKLVHNLCAIDGFPSTSSTPSLYTSLVTVVNHRVLLMAMNKLSAYFSTPASRRFPGTNRYFSPLSTAPINTATYERKEFCILERSA